MIATAFHDYGRILRVTTVQRTPRLLKALAWLTAVLWTAVLAARVAGLFPGVELAPGPLLRQLLFAVALVLIAVWSMVFMPGSVLVHASASARMLPRQRRRLFQLAYWSWALLCGALALSIGTWGLFLVAGMLSLALGLLYSGRPAGGLLLVPWLGGMYLSSFLPSLAAVLFGAAGVRVLGALLLVAGWFALRAQYPVEGSERLRRRTMTGLFESAASQAPGDGSRAHAFLAGSLLRRAARLRDPEALLALGLGPAVHWMAAVALPAALLALVLAAWTVMAWRGAVLPQDFVDSMTAGFAGAAAASISMHGIVLRKQLENRRGQQALLRLTPLLGDKTMLNRRLGTAMLKSGVLCWLVMAAIYLGAMAACGASPAQLTVQLALCCAGGQFALAQLLDDFARRPTLAIGARMGIVWLIVIEAILTLGMGAFAGFSGWPWFAALCIAAGALQVRNGWRRLVAAPPAFPAGRFG